MTRAVGGMLASPPGPQGRLDGGAKDMKNEKCKMTNRNAELNVKASTRTTLSLRVRQIAALLALFIFHSSFFVPPPSSARPQQSTQQYDLLLQGGHVIDLGTDQCRTRVSHPLGKIAAVARRDRSGGRRGR